MFHILCVTLYLSVDTTSRWDSETNVVCIGAAYLTACQL